MQQGDEVAIVTGACKGIGRLRQRRCIRPDSACSAPAGRSEDGYPYPFRSTSRDLQLNRVSFVLASPRQRDLLC
jgi:hypothetical protein